MNIVELVQRLSDLQDSYSLEKRNLITIDKYQDLLKTGVVDKVDLNNPVLQETLMEHVGHLPILATYLHPHIEYSQTINLGKVLMMLALHDIGETVVGDVYTYHKTDIDDKKEFEAAIKLIHPSQVDVYREYEDMKTLESQFAKAVDALAPLIHSISITQLTLDHAYKHSVTIDMIEEHKTKYFLFDEVLKEVFGICVEHYRAVENGENPIFTQRV